MDDLGGKPSIFGNIHLFCRFGCSLFYPRVTFSFHIIPSSGRLTQNRCQPSTPGPWMLLTSRISGCGALFQAAPGHKKWMEIDGSMKFISTWNCLRCWIIVWKIIWSDPKNKNCGHWKVFFSVDSNLPLLTISCFGIKTLQLPRSVCQTISIFPSSRNSSSTDAWWLMSSPENVPSLHRAVEPGFLQPSAPWDGWTHNKQ